MACDSSARADLRAHSCSAAARPIESASILASAAALLPRSLPLPDVVPAQSRAARGGALSRRSVARAGGRGQRQDARHHREDRASHRARPRREARSPRSRSPTRRRARCASGRRGCWRRRARAIVPPTSRSRRFMRSGSRSSAAMPTAFGLKPGFSIFDPGDIEPIVAELLADDRSRPRTRRAVADQRLEECAAVARGRARRRRRATTRQRRPRPIAAMTTRCARTRPWTSTI